MPPLLTFAHKSLRAQMIMGQRRSAFYGEAVIVAETRRA